MNEFNNRLSRIGGLTWLPWIGCDYKIGKSTLMLGESHYCYGNYSPADIEQNRNETWQVVKDYTESGRNAGDQYKTYEPMENVLKNSIIGKETSGKLWERVAFMNLIQSCMENNNDRPPWGLFLNGWRVVLQVINVLRPKECVCFSTDKLYNRLNFNRLEEFKYELSFDYSIAKSGDTGQKISNCIVATPGGIDIGEYHCPVIFVQHASRIKGRAAVRWSNVIDSGLRNW